MTREFGGSGNTIVTFAVTPADAAAPLTILVGNRGWSFTEADDDGYQIEFSGNDAVWNDLAVRTFNTDGDGDDRDGVISIDFAQDAIMLQEIVTTGVTGATERAKVPFTGARVDSSQMPVLGVPPEQLDEDDDEEELAWQLSKSAWASS